MNDGAFECAAKFRDKDIQNLRAQLEKSEEVLGTKKGALKAEAKGELEQKVLEAGAAGAKSRSDDMTAEDVAMSEADSCFQCKIFFGALKVPHSSLSHSPTLCFFFPTFCLFHTVCSFYLQALLFVSMMICSFFHS